MRINPFFLMLVTLFVGVFNQLHAAPQIPFEFRDGLIWVKVSVPGRAERLNFLVDSGAGASVIDTDAARRLGVRLGAPERVLGVNGSATAYQVNHFAGTLGGVAVPRRLLALDLSSVSAVCHQRIDGLLGADYFRNRVVQVDFRTEKLRLLSRAEVNVAGCETLPLIRRGDALCTRIAVAGYPADWVRVDTGSDSALRWVIEANASGPRFRSSIGVAVQPAKFLKADVQLGSMIFEGVKTSIHRKQIFPGEAGLLGNGLLSRFVVTFDVPGKRLLLRPR